MTAEDLLKAERVRAEAPAPRNPRMDAFTNALPHPVLLIEASGRVVEANSSAEAFFQMGRAMLRRHLFEELVGRHSPATALVAQVRERGSAINEYRVELSDPKRNLERTVDIYASAVPEAPDLVLLMLQEQTIAEKFSRQLTHRGAARSVSALAAMLAHEIKNPLSGIRGAAQLLDGSVSDDDRLLTQLIRDETDRIVKLVDRFEMFSEGRPMPLETVNVHAVLEHVKTLAKSGFARHIRFTEDYDPSLPPVLASRDQLVQVFLNLVKNAAEAIGTQNGDGEITLTTSYRPGVSLTIPGSRDRIRLPLEVSVRDNGPGVPQEILQNIFEPFVTTKASGTGLGLALVAKVIGDHGGIVECESVPRRTAFRILLPMQTRRRGVASD